MPAAHRRSLGAVSATALLIAVLGIVPASAGEPIALEQRVLRGPEGSVEELTEVPVDADDVGRRCTLAVHTENQFSVHPGNDLLLTTGGADTVFADVEAEPDGDRDLTADVVLGPTIVVSLRFGPHEVSSMGFELSVSCDRPAASGRSTSTSTTTSSRPSTTLATTTEPITEVSIPEPSIPGPCQDPSADGSAGDGGASRLSVGSDDCPSPTVLPTVIERSTSTTSPPPPSSTTAPPASVESAPSTTSAPPTSSAVTTTTGPTPTVQGIQIFRGLPQTPAASAVQAQPAYTG